MARFKYMGENKSSLVLQGPCTTINIPKKDGTKMVVHGPADGFVIGNDIGVDITDERSLRVMRADTRFSEI